MISRSQLSTLVARSHLLKYATNLADDRSRQLDQALLDLGFTEVPTDQEELTRLQMHTAAELGGVWTAMLLDAPREIMMYHFGPLQIALCLLHVSIEYYRDLKKFDPTLGRVAFDIFLDENTEFVERLGDLRDSVLHTNLDTLPEQKDFVETFSGSSHTHLKTVLAEGERVFREYVRDMGRLRGSGG